MSRRPHSAKPSNAILVNLPWHIAEGRSRPNISISPQPHDSSSSTSRTIRKRRYLTFWTGRYGCLVGEARVGDFAPRSDLARERRMPVRVWRARNEPRPGIARHAVLRPSLQRYREIIVQRVLGNLGVGEQANQVARI